MREVMLGSLVEPAPAIKAGSRQVPILSMTMREGLVDQASKFKKRVASRDTSGYRVVRRGQLVVGFPIDEGVLSFQDLYDEALVSPAYTVWDLRDKVVVEPEFLERYLRSPRALYFYRRKLRGTTARRRSLPPDVFREVPVPLPPVAEQRRIATLLGRVDAVRELRLAALGKLDMLLQALFIDLFGDPGSGEKEWPVRKIGELLESTTYGTSEKAGSAGEFAVLRMNNIGRTGEIDVSDLKFIDLSGPKRDRYMVRAGDVLFNRTNSPELVGKSAVFQGPGEMAYAGYLIRLRCNSDTEPEYLGAFLNSPYAKRVLRSMCKSIIGMANINAKELQGIRIPYPDLALQRRFAEQVRAVRVLKSRHRRALASLEALFASLQHRAFNGTLFPDNGPSRVGSVE